MAKKKKPANKKVRRHTISEEEYLGTLIKFSKRAITKQGSSIDEFFTQQAERLERKLEELRRPK